jgi:hypothetical protein
MLLQAVTTSAASDGRRCYNELVVLLSGFAACTTHSDRR